MPTEQHDCIPSLAGGNLRKFLLRLSDPDSLHMYFQGLSCDFAHEDHVALNFSGTQLLIFLPLCGPLGVTSGHCELSFPLNFQNKCNLLLVLCSYLQINDALFPFCMCPLPARGFPGGTNGKNSPANAGDVRDVGSIPGSGRSPGGGNGNPLQYSCLGNPMDKGAWWATVHGAAKSQTQLSTYLPGVGWDL